ncbi:MAG TPA: primosomal protein N' [Syntrophomonas sp.]|nr:primosomal protein N' [Syntrophomonas sp.]
MRCVQVLINLPSSRMDNYLTYRVPDHITEQELFGRRVLVKLGAHVAEGYVVADGAPDIGQAMKPVLQVLDQQAVINAKMLDLAQWMAADYLCPLSVALGAMLPRPLHRKRGQVVVPLVEPDERHDSREISSSARELMEQLWCFGPLGYQQALTLLGQDELQFLAEQGWITLSSYYKMQTPLPERYYALGDFDPEKDEALLSKKAPRQAEALHICRQKGLVEARALEKIVPKSSLEALLKKGWLRLTAPAAVAAAGKQILTAEQQAVMTALEPSLEKSRFTAWLLHGVTASGKTEVYLQAIQKVIDCGRQAIMLVPEIALTRHLEQVYRLRFPDLVVLHSQMPDRERYRAWLQIQDGRAQVVLGTRSALFAPLTRLGLIILDEEHESTYKQEETPRYHAREVALARARLEQATVIMGSATPALESYYKALKGEYRLLTMSGRIAPARLPRVTIIDMRRHYRQGRHSAISAELREAISARLEQGQQTILFLNRRGYSPVTICRMCGQSLMCPHCAVSLSYHQDSNGYLCHYCDYQQEVIEVCPACGLPALSPLGYGTQKVEAEAAALFPDARVGRLDMDSSRKSGAQKSILNSMKTRQIDILIGTQMVAKGLDYPGVSLVGIVDADITLNLPDFRAYERTLQLVVQASGRAGRGQDPGEVLIQTYNPEHAVIQMAAAQDYESFYRTEIESRRVLQYPPFTHIMRIVVWDGQEKRAQQTAADIFSWIYEIIDAKEDQIMVLGPAPCPISRLRGKYRQQIMIKAQNRSLLSSIGLSLKRLKYPPGVRIEIDIDPMSTL